MPAGFSGANSTAEIALHPSGRSLYGSNRGHDSIGAFSIDDATGRIAPLAWESTQGRKPRFFCLAPGGRYLYAANEDGDTIVEFDLDEGSGKLSATGQVIETGSPACIVFAQ